MIRTEVSTTTTTTQVTSPQVNITGVDAVTVEAALVQFNNAKAAIKALEEQKALAEEILRNALAGSEQALINGVPRFKLAHSSSSKIDRKALQAGWPEAYEATLVTTPYDFIKSI